MQSEVSTVLGYIRCSTEEQGDSGLGLQAQREAIRVECERRGWKLEGILEDVAYSGGTMDRPAVKEAMSAMAAGAADGLLVTRMDRFSRSSLHFWQMHERAQKQGWKLVCMDMPVDMSTPSGTAMAGMMMVFAQYEREMIGLRTKEALAVLKAQGVQLGRPERVAPELCERIRREREDLGYSFRRIARNLTLDGVPTVQGGTQWWASTVQGALRRCEEVA